MTRESVIVRGTTRHTETRKIPISFTGWPLRVLTVIHDVTDLMQAEEETRSSEESYRRLVEMSPSAIFVHQQGEIVFTNRAGTMLLGASGPEQLLGRSLFDFLHPDYKATMLARVAQMQVGTPLPPLAEKVLRLDGAVVDVMVAATRGRWKGQPAVQVVAADLTEQRQLEEERRKLEDWVIQSQKLESLGTLAGGIAHDFNNMLMAILGRISLARLRRPRDESDRDLEAAERACKQAAELTKQLLTFAKGGAPVTQLARIGPIVSETVELCLSGSGVKAELDLRDSNAVRVDPGQIGQVFQNLVINAKQAMNDHGTLRIVSDDIEEGGAIWVRVRVTDTGPGIAEGLEARIFEPYFTTKSGGSGLGLAVAHSVVVKHGGRLTAESAAGQGATFTVLLPASRGRVTPTSPSPASGPPKRARVLVMDDEPELRDLLAQIVSIDGHEVVTTSDGIEAVERFRDAMARGAPFDVAILDLTVPGGVGGGEAVRSILQIDAAAKVVVSSGYSEDPVLASYATHGFAAALAKPYDVGSLREVLGRLLRT